MGQCRFVINNLALSAVYTAGSGHQPPFNEQGWVALSDPTPSNRLRISSIYVTTAGLYRYRFKIDLGSVTPIDTIAMINTTFTAGSSVSAYGYVDDPEVGSPPTAFVLNTGTLVDRVRSNNQVVISSASKIPIRYVNMYIDFTDAFGEIGTMVVGNSWQPTYNFDMEYQVGRVDLGTREFNQTTGAAFNFNGAKPRLWTVTLGSLSVDEVETYVDDIDRLLGSTGDVLFIPEHTDTFNKMSLRSVYGACRLSGEGLAGQFFPNLYRRPMRIQESL